MAGSKNFNKSTFKQLGFEFYELEENEIMIFERNEARNDYRLEIRVDTGGDHHARTIKETEDYMVLPHSRVIVCLQRFTRTLYEQTTIELSHLMENWKFDIEEEWDMLKACISKAINAK